MKEVAFLLYTHSDYSDVWEAFFGQTEELLPETFPKYIFVNDDMGREKLKLIPDDYKIVTYDEESYSNRVDQCLQKVDEEFCIFQHEDMMLYDKPDMKKLRKYLDVLKKDEDLDFVKLLKGGDIDDEPYGRHKDLFLAKQWLLAIQPALWKTATIQKIFAHFSGETIWDLEIKAQEECRKMGVKGIYCYNGEPHRGRHHWDSSVYPYIATAICKGKWNVAEYGSELEELFHEYEIDRSLRGLVV